MEMKDWLAKEYMSGDWVVVTGSTSGIGYHYAKRFAERGCNLICVSNEDAKLEEIKIQLEESYSVEVRNFCADLSDTEQTKQLAGKLAELPVKVLVNNAGFGLKGRFEANEVESYIDVITVNAIAPVILARAILPTMQAKNSGYVIHVASINAIVPIPLNQVYTATKAFCASYALAVSRENKQSKLQFQLVLPGTTKTPFHDRQGVIPKKMVMLPEDVVRASFAQAGRSVCIPNRTDRIVSKLFPFIPKSMAMDIASYMLKKRLGM